MQHELLLLLVHHSSVQAVHSLAVPNGTSINWCVQPVLLVVGNF